MCTLLWMKRREQKKSVGVKRKVDVSELSSSGNSSLVTRKSLAFQETINCTGCSEEYEEHVTKDWTNCVVSALSGGINACYEGDESYICTLLYDIMHTPDS